MLSGCYPPRAGRSGAHALARRPQRRRRRPLRRPRRRPQQRRVPRRLRDEPGRLRRRRGPRRRLPRCVRGTPARLPIPVQASTFTVNVIYATAQLKQFPMKGYRTHLSLDVNIKAQLGSVLLLHLML